MRPDGPICRSSIDDARLWEELSALAGFSDAPAPAVTRIVFTEADLRARAYVKSLCLEAGLAIREDAVGNTFARLEGAESRLPAIGTGSHIDAIPNAGRFDGTVGVLGGLEAIRALIRTGARLRRSIDLILFTSEEPTRFGIGCLGSRLMSGSLDADAAARLADAQGNTLGDARMEAGFTGPLQSVRVPPGQYGAFVELHIEQGPLLERGGIDIGVVTAIAAPASMRLVVEGEGGHAGAVLMKDRRDAFLAAAEIALAVESAAKGSGSDDTVGTVGTCEVFPGAINSVPSRTTIEVDIRDIDLTRRDAVIAGVREACGRIAADRRVTVRAESINADPPGVCADEVVNGVVASCTDRGFSYLSMISRAYHDALFMSRIAPTGMIFVPCRNGVSHRPDEFAERAAIARGAAVLADTLATLASR